VKLLLDRKEVNPGSSGDYGKTPLHFPALGEHVGILKLLLDRKEANPDQRDFDGRTPLWCAIQGGHQGVVKLLQDRSDAEPGTRANGAPTPPSYLLKNSHEGLRFHSYLHSYPESPQTYSVFAAVRGPRRAPRGDCQDPGTRRNGKCSPSSSFIPTCRAT